MDFFKGCVNAIPYIILTWLGLCLIVGGICLLLFL